MPGCRPRRLESRAPPPPPPPTPPPRRPEPRAIAPRRPRPALLPALLAFCAGMVTAGGAVGGAGGAAGAGGAGGLLGANIVCGRGLTDRQKALCHAAPAAVAALGTGLSMAYAECRAQLAGRRWNCSGVGDDARFGHVLSLATREAAFTYAITAAGVTHELASACARGDLPACSCTPHTRRRLSSTSEQWKWGGCGEVEWGARFARRWLDARELERDARAAMNLHNNRLGRKVRELVKDMVRRECKCHGMSGSCAVQTCWRAPPPFAAVGAALRDKYRRARLVAAPPDLLPRDPRRDARTALAWGRHTNLVLKKKGGGTGRPPRKSELVYLDESPDYCEPDDAAAAQGTHGRTCKPNSKGEDGCEALCCRRGHRAVTLVQESKCGCQFHWCCSVTCDTCVTRTQVHVCN